MITREKLERIRVHRNNVQRYQRLLTTYLSDLERSYVQRRLGEEQESVGVLLREAFHLPVWTHKRSAEEVTARLELNALLHPADAFIHPMDVVEDCDLTSYEKRAILSSWAADLCAVKAGSELSQARPAIRVSFEDVLDALQALDAEPNARADERQISILTRRAQEIFP